MREEYPRPDYVREDWMNLNGSWDVMIEGKQKKIEVPFVCQCSLSGIGERIRSDRLTYTTTFQVPEGWRGRRIRLNFGAVDYEARVSVNGRLAGEHCGGFTPFSFDITDMLTWGEETVTVDVRDPLKDEGIARGKQYWEEVSQFIWYTPSSGIWQTVWLEPVEETCISQVHFTPDIDRGTVHMECDICAEEETSYELLVEMTCEGEDIAQMTVMGHGKRTAMTVDVLQKRALRQSFHFSNYFWSPEHPRLFDVRLTLKQGGKVKDQVDSYFGMRKIHTEEGRFYLNNQPYVPKLLLDQGYWKDGLMTAPADEAYREDIARSKAMGFNGCRKHEKVEDPRFLYWADHMGFLVWEAMASFWTFTPAQAGSFMRQWLDVIQRDYNHPSVVAWEMLNESWGVPQINTDKQQRAFAQSLYHMAKSQDQSRLVVSNDGWEMADTDICAFHSYQHGAREDEAQQHRFAGAMSSVASLKYIMEKPLFAEGFHYQGQPVVLSEFGGITINTKSESWGYTSVSGDEFLLEYGRLVDTMIASEKIAGYCYTQLADVEQETNGLLNQDHTYKFDPAELKKINDRMKDKPVIRKESFN